MSEALKIVVPTDFSQESQATLDWVKRLNNRGHAEVHCVHVVPHPAMYMPAMPGIGMQYMPTIDDLRDTAKESLTAFAEQHLADLETPPVIEVLTGRPAEEITAYAKQIDAQMIVIATRGQSGIARMLLGSTVEGVVRQAECAVLTVRS